MTQIITMAQSVLEAELIDKLTASVVEDDPTRAVLVRKGRLQADPRQNHVYVLIHSGDPTDEKIKHTLYTDTLHSGSRVPPREIGSRGSLWIRRLTAEIGVFFLEQGFDRESAAEYAHVVLGRTEKYIDTCVSVIGLADEFGESVYEIAATSSNFTEGGGPPTKFIWRGSVSIQLLTTKSY